ncbi:MAG: 30S ribosome-binding factor RbfA [Candidatus Omnitrophica bacterium]|nr:30S ribosome-binding factor RbfA [Candidatus Omnitrophota bacterium]
MTQKKTYRISQINRLLQEEIASILLMELQDDSLRSLTVTEVRTTRDLYHAFVFIASHKNEDPDVIVDAANQRSRQIQKLLFSRLRLKRIPNLEFRYDDSLDKAERIFQTLEQIRQEEEQQPIEE